MKNEETVQTTARRVKEAAEGCPTAAQALKTLFPEVFAREALDRNQHYVIREKSTGNVGVLLSQRYGDAVMKGVYPSIKTPPGTPSFVIVMPVNSRISSFTRGSEEDFHKDYEVLNDPKL